MCHKSKSKSSFALDTSVFLLLNILTYFSFINLKISNSSSVLSFSRENDYEKLIIFYNS